MQKKAFITAEVHLVTIETLRSIGYEVILGGWGQTRRALTEDELIKHMTGVTLLVVEAEDVTARVIAAAESLELIHVCRAAPKNIDLDAATQGGVGVLCSPARNAGSVAEFTLGVILSLVRNIHRGESHLRSEGWYVGDEIPYFHFRGPEVAGKTLGLIGCGAIGRHLVKLIQGFEMDVLIYDPYLEPEQVRGLGRLVSLDDVMSCSDFIVILCAMTQETEAMIGEKELGWMKKTAYLINMARAAVVQEDILLAALGEGRIAGAALDVFWEEPLPVDSPWLTLENVLLTPHIAGAADNVKRVQGEFLVEDLLTLQEGGIPGRLVNPAVLE